MSNLTKLNRKFDDKLKRKTWQLDNTAGLNRLADAVIVGEKERTSGCFSAVVAPVLLIVAGALMAVLS